MSSKRPASGSAGSKATKMARPEQSAASVRAGRSASRAKITPNNNSNVKVGSKETLARPVVTPEITSPLLKVEAVKVKKLQKRKGVRVWTTKGKLRAAGMSDAQAKTIPAKATRAHMLYGTIVGRNAKGIQVEFDLFPAAEKTFTCSGDRLTVVPPGAEEPTMSERERKKIAVCFSKGNQPISHYYNAAL